MAAFREPLTETHATGTPGGICTIESSASRPLMTLLEEVSGTPITGRSLYEATTPGSAAAIPAPAMSTLVPRSAAVDAYSATPRGSRWADRTWSPPEIPRSSNSTQAGSMASRSDSEPMRIPTSGPTPSNSSITVRGRGLSSGIGVNGCERDVVTVLDFADFDLLGCPIGGLSRGRDRVAQPGDVQDTSAGRDERALPDGRPGVEDHGSGRLRRFDAFDRDARRGRLRVAGRGQDNGDGRFRARCQLDVGQRAGRDCGERSEQVALETGKDRLGLGIAEAAVELEDPGPVLGQHEPGIEESLEGRPAGGELAKDG